jgi:hypothetical protein
MAHKLEEIGPVYTPLYYCFKFHVKIMLIYENILSGLFLAGFPPSIMLWVL